MSTISQGLQNNGIGSQWIINNIKYDMQNEKHHTKSFMPIIYMEFKIIILYIIGIMSGVKHVILQNHRNFVRLGFCYVYIFQKLVEN